MLQARDIEKALDSFTRAAQLDPENGEVWNNIACLYVLPPCYRSFSFSTQNIFLFFLLTLLDLNETIFSFFILIV